MTLFKKKKKSITSLEAQAKIISRKKPDQLTAADRKIIATRISQIKRHNRDRKTVQNTIEYMEMFKDGICQISENQYSKTIQFFDADYQLADFDEQNFIFSKYCDILNSFDNTTKFQLTFENQCRSQKKILKSISIQKVKDSFDDIRQEYSDMLCDKLQSGVNGQSARKFLTFTITAESYQTAKRILTGIQNDIVKLFKEINVDAVPLNGSERLETMYYSLNPYRDQPFVFDWSMMKKAGMDTKDSISPPSLKFNKANFEIGGAYGCVSNMSILAGELPDSILRDFISLQHLFCINIHCEPMDHLTALKFIRQKLVAVESTKVDEQKKASAAGYDPDILPASLKMYITDLEKTLDDLNSKNERLFHISLVIRNYATTRKNLKLQLDMLKRICIKNNCMMSVCDFLQEDGLNTTLPLGVNKSQISREMHTSGIAIFMPFTTMELFQEHGCYYGLNSVSGNMIMADRTLLKNPNGIVFGVPGSGKTFSVKREIFDCFLKTSDDFMIVDPEGEYYTMVQKLNGQVVRISSTSRSYINPMDINFEGSMEENPVAVKSNFLISLCEIAVGDRYGLEGEEKSVIDKCVRSVYTRFLNNNPSYETMPTLSDLQEELKKHGDVARRVANSLDMYVTGTQNLFNHRTNIDLNNRIVCFDIKELSNQLKKIGMLIVQDMVWNRVSANRAEKRSTRYYIDEFHLLLREPQTANYSVEMWKRFRKWGGIPTGITQNVKDFLASPEIENIFDNSDFVYLLSQAAGDRDIIAQKLHISPEQTKYITNSGPGEGLIKYGKTILPFTDQFPADTEMYRLMTSKLSEQING